MGFLKESLDSSYMYMYILSNKRTVSKEKLSSATTMKMYFL